MKQAITITRQAQRKPMQFKVGVVSCTPMPYNRRDFYKITLLKSSCRLHYASRGIDINKPALVFTNPLVPYSFEEIAEEQSGYFCLFTEDFFQAGRTESLQDFPLFRIGADPVLFPDREQVTYISSLFERMLAEFEGEYIYKYELLRNQISLIIHEAIKMQPASEYFGHQNAAARITGLFLELLDRQFPIDSPQQYLKLRKAGDYANCLSVHINHLNAVVRETTGKSTTAHINEKIVQEAKALLAHTDWSIADIAYSLGFEYPSYFNSFFKKHCAVTPMAFRKAL